MSATGLLDTQAAIYAKLAGDRSVTSLVTGVFDAVPEGQQRPYVVVGEFTEIPNKSFGNNGHELTATIHVYDQDGITFNGAAAKGGKRALTILNALIASLESMTDPAVANHTLVEVTYEFGQPMREDDQSGGIYRHIPARFRVVLEDL